jgi:hypothetical protein
LAIAAFERLGLIGLGLDLVQHILLFPRRSAKNGALFEIAMGPLTLLFILVLILLVSRKRSRAAQWLLLMLVAGAAAMSIATARTWIGDPPLILGAVSSLLAAVAVAFTFAPSARAWLSEPKASG